MNEYQAALLIGATVGFLISGSLPRARLYVVAGALSFAATSIYWGLGLPFPPWFSILADGAVCLLIYHVAQEPWELRLWRIFQGMILINLLFFMGAIGPHSAYIIALELMNWAALILIAGTSLLSGVSVNGDSFNSRWSPYLRWAAVSLRGKRTRDPWHKVAK
jgi:hypothetical protein